MRAYHALTAYKAVIPKAFADRSQALRWAAENADRYPGCRIVQQTAIGWRTIWKHTEAAA